MKNLPLSGRRIVLTRARDQSAPWREKLASLGAEVLELPLIEIRGAVDAETAADVFAELGSYDWGVFSSSNGVRYFFEEFFRRHRDIRAVGGLRFAVVGAHTADAVRAFHLEPELIPEVATAEALLQAMLAAGSVDNLRILVVSGDIGSDPLIKGLEAERAIVDRLNVYANLPAPVKDEPASADFRERGADAIVFASPSAVRSFYEQAGHLALAAGARRPISVSFGPLTSAALKEHKMPVDLEAEESSLPALAEALVRRFGPAK